VASQVSRRDSIAAQPTVELDIVPGAHSPSPVQVPVPLHAHSAVHVSTRDPQLPQGLDAVVPAVQTPSNRQKPYDQTFVPVQNRVMVPQRSPHGRSSIALGLGHMSLAHAAPVGT
jgi:hypothetical protein